MFAQPTHLLAILACPLNTLLKCASPHVRTLSLAEPVVHQAVAQPDTLFGLCEHHICGCTGVSRVVVVSLLSHRGVK
jgi:hypothetical protein